MVSTELGTGASWVTQDGVAGRVAPANAPAALAQTIRPLIDDRDGRKRMGAAARERARKDFNLEQMLEGVEHVYRAVLEMKSWPKAIRVKT